MDRAPPPRVIIEYDPDETDRFIAIADAVEDVYPEIMVDGNPDEILEPRPGSFEVTLEDGTVLFSKLKDASNFPTDSDVIAAVEAFRRRMPTNNQSPPSCS